MTEELSIRGGSGLGDALYVQAIARHLAKEGRRVEACADWPDLFRPLHDRGVRVSPFRRRPIDLLAHYAMRRGIAGTTQFEDCLISAGLKGRVDLRLDWRVSDVGFTAPLRRSGRPLVAVLLPRAPMARKDGFGRELLPNGSVMQGLIDRLKPYASLVQVGAGTPLYRLSGIDVDLANHTTVGQLLDVMAGVDAVLGYPSFAIPLAESLGTPALILWSRAGIRSRHLVIRQMTPAKLIHDKRLVAAIIDDEPLPHLQRGIDALLDAVRSPIAV